MTKKLFLFLTFLFSLESLAMAAGRVPALQYFARRQVCRNIVSEDYLRDLGSGRISGPFSEHLSDGDVKAILDATGSLDSLLLPYLAEVKYTFRSQIFDATSPDGKFFLKRGPGYEESAVYRVFKKPRQLSCYGKEKLCFLKPSEKGFCDSSAYLFGVCLYGGTDGVLRFSGEGSSRFFRTLQCGAFPIMDISYSEDKNLIFTLSGNDEVRILGLPDLSVEQKLFLLKVFKLGRIERSQMANLLTTYLSLPKRLRRRVHEITGQFYLECDADPYGVD